MHQNPERKRPSATLVVTIDQAGGRGRVAPRSGGGVHGDARSKRRRTRAAQRRTALKDD